jgi:hypothetical protein
MEQRKVCRNLLVSDKLSIEGHPRKRPIFAISLLNECAPGRQAELIVSTISNDLSGRCSGGKQSGGVLF